MKSFIAVEIRTRIGSRDYRFTLHAGDKMTERHISVREFEEAVLDEHLEVIEDYPGDIRGASCLLSGSTGKGRRLHIHCTYPPEVAIITVYEPRPEDWINGKTRVGRKR
ncbi:MAG: DUF4258 domain-containing protein [Actinomycetota bacterium]